VKRTNGSTAVGLFKRVFSEQELNRLGKEVRYCQRERVVTPFRLVMAMLSTLSSRKVETLADLQRGFNALFGERLAYKPFHESAFQARVCGVHAGVRRALGGEARS